jgi:hypothetical protein
VVDPAHRRNLVVQGCPDAERLDLDQGSRSTAANDNAWHLAQEAFSTSK